MNATLWTILASVAASLGTFYATTLSKRKIRVEADSVIVASAEGVVKIAVGQLERLSTDVARLTTEVAEYRSQVLQAQRSEANLKKEVSRLRKRVGDLERFIIKSGLTIPSETDEAGDPYPHQPY